MEKTLKSVFRLLALIIIASLLIGCASQSGEETLEIDEAVFEDFTPIVSATGELVPQEWSSLSVSNSGIIDDLFVEVGDKVDESDVLLKIGGSEQLISAATAAQYELLLAKQNLEDLYTNAEVQRAQAELVLAQTSIALEDAIDERDRKDYRRVSDSTLEGIRADYYLAEDALDKAEEYFEAFEDRPEDDPERAQALSALSNAKKNRDRALNNLNYALGKPDADEVAEADAMVALAQANFAKAQEELEKLKEGPDPEDVELANARIASAEDRILSANSALENQELKAPFSGTVSELYVRSKEWVMAGQPVMVLADLENLRIETTDLSELDVAQIEIGNSAAITFDALPDIEATGKVINIAPRSSQGAGVNYTVILELDEDLENLRWGMTAFVDISIEE